MGRWKMDKTEYIEYLKSEDWRVRRKMLMEEADWTCCECGLKATQLHHLSYENLGEEELEVDVIALCTACHKEKHNKQEYGEW